MTLHTAIAIATQAEEKDLSLSKSEFQVTFESFGKPSQVRKARQLLILSGLGKVEGLEQKGVSPVVLFKFPDKDTAIAAIKLAANAESTFGKQKYAKRVQSIDELVTGELCKATGIPAQQILDCAPDNAVLIKVEGSVKRTPTYIATLRYQQHSKMITGTLDTKSANRCCIQAVTEALLLINRPCTVLIESSADFYSRKGVNASHNQQIDDIISEKKLSVCVCLTTQFSY